jgi:hypothetical protein
MDGRHKGDHDEFGMANAIYKRQSKAYLTRYDPPFK